MWLLRGLSFTCKALQFAQANQSEELATAFGKSYEATLKKFHNFVVKGIFAVRNFITPKCFELPFTRLITGGYESMPLQG